MRRGWKILFMHKRAEHLRVFAEVLILIASIILFSGCSKSNTETFPAENQLRWIYSTKGGIRELSLSSNGESLAIIETKEISYGKYKSFLYLFNKEGKIQQSYDFKKNISVLDFKFSPNNRYVAVALGSLLTKGGRVFLFDKDKLLWSKEIWGKPYFWITPEVVAVATHEEVKDFYDEELPVNRVCIDPNLTVGGEGALICTFRGKTFFYDTSGNFIAEDNKLVGIATVINEDYFLTSCLRKTTVYNKKGRIVWSTHDSGDIHVSSDGKYVLIDSPKLSSLYAISGNALWKKKKMYPAFPLDGGYTITTHDIYGSKRPWDDSPDYRTISLYESKGQKVWEMKQGPDGFGPFLFTVTSDGKHLVVSFQKKITVKKSWHPRVKQFLKESGLPETVTGFINKVSLLDLKRNIAWTSEEIQTEDPLKYIATDFSGSHIVISDGSKIYFYETGISGNQQR